MVNYKANEQKYQKELIVSMLTSILQNTSEDVKNKCIEYSINPDAEFPKDVQKALDLLELTRMEYNKELDILRDKYEVRLKTAMVMLVNAISRSNQ